LAYLSFFLLEYSLTDHNGVTRPSQFTAGIPIRVPVVGERMTSSLHTAFHLTCSTESWSFEQCRIHRKKCSRFVISA